jgi:Chaperone of endosialidase
MPNLFLADMVRELSSSTGTGAFTLDGAAPGHRGFAAAVPINATFPYAICGVSDESQWETGEGTLSATGQLIRSPKDSSAGGALVNFGAGLKTVALSVGAHWYTARDSIDGHNHAIGAVTGLTAQLADKASLAAALAATNFVQATDKLSLMRGNDQWALTGDHIMARRAAAGPFVAQGDVTVEGTGRFGAGAAKFITHSDSTYSGWYNGATLQSNEAIFGGVGSLHFVANGTMQMILGPGYLYPTTDNTKLFGLPSLRWAVVYAGTGSINTSDERKKADIGPIPDDWLDAWGDVEWCRFRFNDGKRWHVGLIAQRVHAAFAARGLDAFDIGLCCFDAWPEQRGPMFDAKGNITDQEQVMRAAGDIWGLRYDECLALESAWVRRELARLQARKSDKRNRTHDA